MSKPAPHYWKVPASCALLCWYARGKPCRAETAKEHWNEKASSSSTKILNLMGFFWFWDQDLLCALCGRGTCTDVTETCMAVSDSWNTEGWKAPEGPLSPKAALPWAGTPPTKPGWESLFQPGLEHYQLWRVHNLPGLQTWPHKINLCLKEDILMAFETQLQAAKYENKSMELFGGLVVVCLILVWGVLCRVVFPPVITGTWRAGCFL